MYFKELRYVLAIKECGSISKAAEKLYLTQPALSRYIKNLEDSLDTKLFEKSGRKLILTDSGARYVATAYKMMDIYDELIHDLHVSNNTIRGSLRIGTTRQRGPMLLPRIIAEFSKTFPNVELTVYEDNSLTLETMLAEGDIDFIIAKGPVSNIDSFERIPLFTEELILVTPGEKSFLKKYFGKGPIPTSVKPALFKDETFILLKPGHHTRNMSELIFTDAGFYPNHVMEISNAETVVRLVEQLQAVTFIPYYFASGENAKILNFHTFTIETETIPPILGTFNIFYRKYYPITRYGQAFIDITQGLFGNIES